MTQTKTYDPSASRALRPAAPEIRRFCRALCRPGEVREVRIPRTRSGQLWRGNGVQAGWFDELEKLVQAVLPITGADAEGVFVSLNPVNDPLLARRANRLADVGRGDPTTTDADISRRTNLLIDPDPLRPSGISATDEEMAEALRVRDQIQPYLADQGWPEPRISGMSGNGGGLIYAIDLPNDDAATTLVRQVLAALASSFNTPTVKVDQTVYNAARITKIYGTVAAKGDPIAERPWRVARAEYHYDSPPVPRALLEQLAAQAPATANSASRKVHQPPLDGPADEPASAVTELLDAAGIVYSIKEQLYGMVYRLARCPTSDDHSDGAAIIKLRNGALAFRCQHDRCADKQWKDVRPLLVSGAKGTDPPPSPPALRCPGERNEARPRLPDGYAPSAWGNAQRLVAGHGADMRYSPAWGKWLVWDDWRWLPDATAEVCRRVKDTVREMYRATALLSDEEREDLVRWALRSESVPATREMLEHAKSEPGIPITPSELDRDPWLLNTPSGTLDLRTGNLREHLREDLLTKLTPVPYIPDACCPTWLAFLEQILPDPDVRAYVQKALGYSLTGDVREQVLFFAYGSGSNGKSTLIKAILEILGSDYAKQAAPDVLVASKQDRHPTELADLAGVRFVATIEVSEGKTLAEALVKQLTGGDRLKARRMREDFWEFEPTFKLLLAANHLPTIRGSDWGIWRRIKLIPFTVTIPDAHQDKRLPAKLRDEYSGVLAWLVAGCLAWQHEGLVAPPAVEAATAGYRAEADVFGAFLDERCSFRREARITSQELYDAYQSWCFANNETALPQNRVGTRLAGRGCTATRTGSPQVRGWAGVELRPYPSP
jgi:P4 family phage/plasmid primase-like protien